MRIWNVARTQSEINSNMPNELSLPQSGLVAYYKFNQGIANGNNTSITTLIDEIGINNGTLIGISSNWIGNSTLSVNSVNSKNINIKTLPKPFNRFYSTLGVN